MWGLDEEVLYGTVCITQRQLSWPAPQTPLWSFLCLLRGPHRF